MAIQNPDDPNAWFDQNPPPPAAGAPPVPGGGHAGGPGAPAPGPGTGPNSFSNPSGSGTPWGTSGPTTTGYAGPGSAGYTPSTTGAKNASQYDGQTTPEAILAYVQDQLAGTGREGDANYWAQQITAKGGGPNAYWDNLIQKNQGGDAGGGGFSYPKWTDTFSYAPWTQTFTAPTEAQAEATPGFQSAIDTANRGLGQNAAAAGTGFTTGTLKDISAFDVNAADQNYQNVYNNALTGYQTALQGYVQNYNTAAQQYNQRYQQYLNGYNQAFNTYQGNFSDSNLLNQEGFANNLSLAQVGENSVTNTNTNAGQYGTNAGNLITGQGNVQAGGTIANANIWGNTLGNLNNNALPSLFSNGTQSSYWTPGSTGKYAGQPDLGAPLPGQYPD